MKQGLHKMLNFNQSSDSTIIRTIENHDRILWAIERGVRYPSEVQEFVKKELAEMEAEMKRRYPDAV
jgi:succinate dehydrogenase flavin-adding protein (antitoxin of CptAB toxin-antitoxin module)